MISTSNYGKRAPELKTPRWVSSTPFGAPPSVALAYFLQSGHHLLLVPWTLDIVVLLL